MPLVELQPDVRFVSNAQHPQEEISNCKIITTYIRMYMYVFSYTCTYSYICMQYCYIHIEYLRPMVQA